MKRTTMALAVLLAAPAWGASLHLSSANVAQPGDVGEVCVALDSGGELIAGTQNDLIWDGACATLGECRVDPSTGKELAGRVQGSEDFRYRAIVLSLTDVEPIPDGPLYCCEFQVDAMPGSCCEARAVDAGASDPNGNALPLAVGPPARLCVSDDGTPFATPTPTFAVTSVAADSDGCQTAGVRATATWPLLPIIPLLWWRSRLGARAARPQR